MRKWILGGGVAVLVLALASVAFASFTQVSKVTLTATKAGQSTGIRSKLQSLDPTAPQPKATTRLVITLPRGTRFNLSTPKLTACTVSDKQLRDQFGKKCPSRSMLAEGTAILNQWQMVPAGIPATVKAYLGQGNIILVVQPKMTALKAYITVLHATVSGSSVTIQVPKIIWGADKKTHFHGVKVVLVSFQLTVPAIGSGSSALITAGRCTARKFVVKSHFVYADGSKLDLTSASRCR